MLYGILAHLRWTTYNEPMPYLFLILILGLSLGGCCSDRSSPGTSQVSTDSQDFTEVEEESEELDEFEDLSVDVSEDEASSYSMTIDEKFEQFREKLEYTQDVDLVHYARDLYNQLPLNDTKKRLELSFFLSQAYKKRGEMDEASQYSKEFESMIKANTGGKAFREHQQMKKSTEIMSRQWEEEQSFESQE